VTQDAPYAPADPAAPADAPAQPPITDPDLVVVHFDTVDLRLSRGGITLRRAAGSTDDGWFLDLPGTLVVERSVLRRPLGHNPMAIPPTLLALLRARLRGLPIGPIELVAVTPAESGDDNSGPLRAVDVVRAHLSHLVTALVEIDLRVRLKHATGVDQMWQLSQRLAGCLVDFGPLFTDPAGLQPGAETGSKAGRFGHSLAVEVDWLGQVLEAARNAQVIADRLAAELDRQPAEFLSESMRRRIGRDVQQQGRRAQIALVQALNSRRYLVLLDGLEEFVAVRPGEEAEPEPESVAPEDVSSELTRLAARSHQRLLRAMKAAEHDRLDQGSGLDRMLTAVSRARYAAEAVAEVIGKPARRYASRAAKVQAILQDQHDVILLRSELIALAGRAHRDPDSAFSYGRLHAGLERQAEFAADEFADRWSRLIERAERWPG